MSDDESLFEQLQAEAVTPLHLELPDGDDTAAWTITAVDSDGIIELDELNNPVDVIDALVGEDLADDIVELLDPLPWTTTVDTARLLRTHFALDPLPGGMWQFLVEQIDLYGEDIESDLAEHRSADLLDWFRGRRPWPQLARFLPRLPEGCRYRARILADEDLARERLENASDDDPPPPDRPSWVGETREVSHGRAQLNLLRRIEHAIYNAQAPKNKRQRPPEPLKGPETAEERIRDALGDAEVEEIFDQVIPGWSTEHAPSGYRQTLSGLLVPLDADQQDEHGDPDDT